MITKKIEKRDVEVVHSVACNKCGNSCIPNDSTSAHGLIGVAVDGGYYSTHLEDGLRYKFDMCEKCLVELFNTFSIPVEVNEYSLMDVF